MKKEALLIIDMLNDFVRPGAPLEVPDNRKIVRNIQQEVNSARAEGRPVIYVCDAHAPDDKEFSRFGWPAHAVKGTKGAEIIDELAPRPGDVVVKKGDYSAFYGTNLDDILKKLEIDSIRLMGCVTHICILFTAYEIVLRNLTVTVVEDGVAGIAQEDHIAALRIMKNVLGAKMVKAGMNVADRKAA